jgi:hypothetical protein
LLILSCDTQTPNRDCKTNLVREGLAFLILTHDKQTVAYLSRLIEALNKPGHIVLVHVDAKVRPKAPHNLKNGCFLFYLNTAQQLRSRTP